VRIQQAARVRHTRGDPPSTAPAAGVARTAFIIGDSLTEHAYHATPFYWANGMMRGKSLQLIHNAGHSGQTISGLGSQIEEDWIDAAGGPMGLVGMPVCGWGFLRIGTNNARGTEGSTGVPIDSTMQTSYEAIIARLLDFCAHLVILPVPPIGGASLSKNTAVPGYNAFLQGLVDADTTGRLHWLDDTTDLIDGSGNVLASLFIADELHPNPAGTYQMALTAEPQLAALLANQSYTSDLITSAADVYPSTDNWCGNTTNVGTGGTLGAGLTGTAPDGFEVLCSSGAAAALSIVAADGGDPNTVPWVRITPSAHLAGGYLSCDIDGAGRTVTSSDPQDIEQMVEVRFNAVDTSKLIEVYLELRVGAYRLPKLARLRFGGLSSLLSRTVVLRQRIHRTDTNADTGTVRNYFAVLGNTSSGSMGSIDFRCYSNKG
jgi:lysophospholipase L1-like esterase